MSFKVTCGECGAEGEIFQKKGVGVFSRAVRGEGSITISYGGGDDGDSIVIECTNCGHEVSDE
jgi:ribosomal protein S27E